jgi:hypothetical protein
MPADKQVWRDVISGQWQEDKEHPNHERLLLIEPFIGVERLFD